MPSPMQFTRTVTVMANFSEIPSRKFVLTANVTPAAQTNQKII